MQRFEEMGITVDLNINLYELDVEVEASILIELVSIQQSHLHKEKSHYI